VYGLLQKHEHVSKESITTAKDVGGMTSSAGMFGLATIVDVPDIYIAPPVPGQSSEELDECSRPDISATRNPLNSNLPNTMKIPSQE